MPLSIRTELREAPTLARLKGSDILARLENDVCARGSQRKHLEQNRCLAFSDFVRD